MVRASTSGMYDFSKFDPADRWSTRKLAWVLNDLNRQQRAYLAEKEHQHWLALLLQVHVSIAAANGNDYRTAAINAYKRMLRATLSWDSDKLGEDDNQTSAEAAVILYQQVYGKPGEERYERMIDELIKESKRPLLTTAEKQRARFKRRRAREAAEKLAQQSGAKDG